MIAETIQDLKQATEKAHESLKRELAKVRTGRAHPSILESVRVDAYGQRGLAAVAEQRERPARVAGRAAGQPADGGAHAR